MGGSLQVDPADYVAASSTMGVLLAATVRAAGDGLTATLSGCGGMAGRPPRHRRPEGCGYRLHPDRSVGRRAGGRTVKLTEALAVGGHQSSTEVTLSGFDKPVTITAPPAGQVATP